MDYENRLVVGDTGWAESIPQWLKDQISSERFIDCVIELTQKKKQDLKASDAELVVYLMTACLRGPISSDMTDIYLYLTAKVMLQAKKIKEEKDLPDFLQEIYKKGLLDWQKTQLAELRGKIGRSRGKVKHPITEAIKEAFKT